MDESERYFAFETAFTLPDGEEQEFQPLLLISKDPFTKVNPNGAPLPTPDFMLSSATPFSLQKAYFARFVHPKQQDKIVAWSGYVNMSKPQIHMQGTGA